jgi:hypothetical protein
MKKINILLLSVLLSCNSGLVNIEKEQAPKNVEKTTDLAVFKDYKLLRLPILLEKPNDYEDLAAKIKKLDVAVYSQMNQDAKKNIFITEDNIVVELKCFNNLHSTDFEFRVLDKAAQSVGDALSVVYYGGHGAMYNTWQAASSIQIENNRIKVETSTEISSPVPGTDMENPELKEEKKVEKKVYKISPKGIFEEK